ncbi:MAG: hypothetical protein EOP61_40735 [Sphingomonadales bacterium]|nr:MAG: hypothetical protein EOP61_40735 [Sphingomonadales bacterium]
MLAVGAWMFIESLRSRPRRSAYRHDFRRMESPAARQRRHAAQRASGQHAHHQEGPHRLGLHFTISTRKLA